MKIYIILKTKINFFKKNYTNLKIYLFYSKVDFLKKINFLVKM